MTPSMASSTLAFPYAASDIFGGGQRQYLPGYVCRQWWYATVNIIGGAGSDTITFNQTLSGCVR